MSATISRNDPCPCGSGLKYKKCCLPRGGVDSGKRSRRFQILAVVVVVAAIAAGVAFGRDTGLFVGAGSALLVGVYYFLLGDPPPHQDGDVVEEVALGVAVAILLGEQLRGPLLGVFGL